MKCLLASHFQVSNRSFRISCYARVPEMMCQVFGVIS
jgi:hypothetical protein